MTVDELKEAMLKYLHEYAKGRHSKMGRAIIEDAIDMTSDLEELPESREHLKKMLLNGAISWYQYSWGGCALIYDGDIAEHYLTAGRYKAWQENRVYISGEKLLEIQAEALEKAERLVGRAYRNVTESKGA